MSAQLKHACCPNAETTLLAHAGRGVHALWHWKLYIDGKFVSVSFCPWCGQQLQHLVEPPPRPALTLRVVKP